MPYLSLSAAEPWAETYGVMLFPDDEGKRRTWIARHWSRFYPAYRNSDAGPPIGERALLAILADTDLAPLDRDEILQRHHQALAVGETLKLVMAIAGTNPGNASWKEAAKLAEWMTRGLPAATSARTIYRYRDSFDSVAHLWAAWTLRDRRFWSASDSHYYPLDDLHVFLAESMAILQWASRFRLRRAKSEITLDPSRCWRTPDNWSPPVAKPGWPRDGRVRAVELPPEWRQRIGKALRKPVTRR